MKLKVKLIYTFLILILAPMILSMGFIWALGQYQLHILEIDVDLEGRNVYETFSNTTGMLSSLTSDMYSDLQKRAEEAPAFFEDERYLTQKNEELGDLHSYLIVRKGNHISYCGNRKKAEGLLEKLPADNAYGEEKDSGIFWGGEIQSLVKQINISFKDGDMGSAFIVTSSSGIVTQLKNLLVEIVLAVLSILAFTSAALTMWIYRSIVTPIQQLKLGTQNIMDGNLDFEMEINGEDEVSELCTDFEDMRRRLKESAEEKVLADQNSKELISNISHDLKTPITAIKGYVEGLMDGVADTPEKREKYLKTIYNKANDMDRLINELTFYSKIDTDRIPYTFEKISVNDYFADCIEEIGLELEEQKIELTYSNYVDSGVQFIGDVEQIKRVVNNIVGNSIKYLDKSKGFIHIRIKDVGDYIQVEIEDNGKGIATKDLPYVFDRFYRTDASRNSSKGGSGIGLSIVKKILEDHGGKVWATSKEHTGTVMYLVFRKFQEVPVEK